MNVCEVKADNSNKILQQKVSRETNLLRKDRVDAT